MLGNISQLAGIHKMNDIYSLVRERWKLRRCYAGTIPRNQNNRNAISIKDRECKDFRSFYFCAKYPVTV